MNKRNYSFGVYYYVDSETGLIDYIGFDSHIDSKDNRDFRHLKCKPQIKFEEVLQKNPDRWEYHVYKKFDTLEEADKCEFDLINLYRPRFNFKHGGINGRNFYQDFEYSVSKAGKNGFKICDRSNKPIKNCRDKSKLEPIATALNNGEITEEETKAIDLNPFEYSVIKAGFIGGKQNYTINDRDNKRIKSSINKEALDEIVVALNNGKITEEEVKVFKYTVRKAGFTDGKQRYAISDKYDNPIKSSINKEGLDEIAIALNNGKITEEEAKNINLNLFKYTVSKNWFKRNGKRNYAIRNRENKSIKSSINKKALDEIATALNNGEITEEEVKSVRGINKVLEMLN